VLYVITITFASVDWAMSLEPHWYSTIFMAAFGMGQVLEAFVFCVAVTLLLSLRDPATASAVTAPQVAPPAAHPEGQLPPGEAGSPVPAPPSERRAVLLPHQTLNDLGNLMLAFIMVFAYLAMCQFLLIWSGNLPIEVTWYIRRGLGPDVINVWTYVAFSLAFFHFVLPFFLLLSTDIKRNRKRLLAIALIVLAARLTELVWVIVPAFTNTEEGRFRQEIDLGVLLYPAALLGVGGLWLAFYLWQLQRLPLLPLYNPEEVAGHGEAAH
jgi:hypothetical protein